VYIHVPFVLYTVSNKALSSVVPLACNASYHKIQSSDRDLDTTAGLMHVLEISLQIDDCALGSASYEPLKVTTPEYRGPSPFSKFMLAPSLT